MIELLNNLEPRFYNKDSILAKELDECFELLFVEQGKYKIGYAINN